MSCPRNKGETSGGGGMTAKDKILSNLFDQVSTLDRQEQPRPVRDKKGWELFFERFETLGGKVSNDLAWLEDKKVYAEQSVSNLIKSNSELWEAEVTVSFAIGVIAETGSLIVDSRPGCERLSTLVGPINIIVVHENTIYETVEEALSLITDRNAAIITGPSRTADIEGIMVRGIHGPRELWIHRIKPQ